MTGGTSASIWGYVIVAILTLTIGSSLAESNWHNLILYFVCY